MEFGMQIARHCILKEINNGCQKNLVISPLLLHIALNMVSSASTGRTLEQFLHFLESDSITDLNAQSSVFMELATNSEGGAIISLINGIWLDHHLPVKHSFKQLAEELYGAKAESVDFLNQEKQVRAEINSWATKASDGHMNRLLPRNFFTEDTIALLASAIYFNAKWLQKFDASNTKNEDFHLLNGETVKVPFIKKSNTTQLYGSFESFKLLKMDYKVGHSSDTKKYTMYIFLPHEKDGLQELVEKFHSDPRFLLENLEVPYVYLTDLWLPKLKYEYELNAKDTMRELGLDLPFDEKRAEITEMVETREIVYLSKAIQKSYIEVDEEGTIATGITRLGGHRGCRLMPPSPPRPSFVADHPFLFMIKEEFSGIILFVGATLNPSSEKTAGKKRKMKATKEGKKKQKDRRIEVEIIY